MSLAPGTKLGPYEIFAGIGAGGMGEVYRARDTRLNREVAIKISAERFSDRFEREAHSIAALNHPNICTLHDVGPNYLVMELVEGPTLAEKISEGPIPEAEAMLIAGQIAEALEAAHEKGIVHRDLKPGNIKIKADGAVKVLDFGLAKMAGSSLIDGSRENSPTLTIQHATQAGIILGTAAYMAPEQVRGKAVDQRADIWAFGVVLFEMLSGRRLYEGDSSAEILASVIKDEPKLNHLPPNARCIIDRCLRKDPRRRWQSIGDVRLAVEEPLISDIPGKVSPSRRPIAWMILSACLALTLAAVSFLYFRREPDQARVLKFFVPVPENATLNPSHPPAVSPDGRHVAFTAAIDGKNSLWMRDLDSLTTRAMSAADGAEFPFWSPDSRFLAFFAGGKLKKIDLAGTFVTSICDVADGDGGSWSKNDVILFRPDRVRSSGLQRVAAAGGNPTSATSIDAASGEFSHVKPWFLPDGRHFLFTSVSQNAEKTQISVGELDSQSKHSLVTANSNGIYSLGYLLYLRGDTLLAQPFDVDRARVTGDPLPAAEHVDSVGSPFYGSFGLFSASQNGVLAYTSSGRGADSILTWFDRSGKALGTVGRASGMEWPTLSPDGNTVAIDRFDPQSGYYDLWLRDLSRGTESRFTVGSKNNDSPIWSPDSREIVFSSTRNGIRDLYVKVTSGAARDAEFVKSEHDKFALDWSRDGRYLFYSSVEPKTQYDIWVLPLFGDRKPFPYLQGPSNEDNARLSPNGRWLAYTSDETGQFEVFVRRFPADPSASEEKWQVSTGGGYIPAWSGDGKELFYLTNSPYQGMFAAKVSESGTFKAGNPRRLFGINGSTGQPWFDLARDGRFLVSTKVQQTSNAPLTIVLNWAAGLKK